MRRVKGDNESCDCVARAWCHSCHSCHWCHWCHTAALTKTQKRTCSVRALRALTEACAAMLSAWQSGKVHASRVYCLQNPHLRGPLP